MVYYSLVRKIIGNNILLLRVGGGVFVKIFSFNLIKDVDDIKNILV